MKKNPLTNKILMNRLNPFDKVRRANEQKQMVDRQKAKVASAKKDRKASKKAQALRRKPFNAVWAGMEESFKTAEVEWQRIGADANEKEASSSEDEDN